jgi:hypothetical protein
MSTTDSSQEETAQRTTPPNSCIETISTTTTNNQFNHFTLDPYQPQTLSYMSRATALEAGKITATSTHFELEQPNCVSTLMTMSCRGRAEAFARSLQTKLRNLGQVREKHMLSE